MVGSRMKFDPECYGIQFDAELADFREHSNERNRLRNLRAIEPDLPGITRPATAEESAASAKLLDAEFRAMGFIHVGGGRWVSPAIAERERRAS